jgi:hypothetical protein
MQGDHRPSLRSSKPLPCGRGSLPQTSFPSRDRQGAVRYERIMRGGELQHLELASASSLNLRANRVRFVRRNRRFPPSHGRSNNAEGEDDNANTQAID